MNSMQYDRQSTIGYYDQVAPGYDEQAYQGGFSPNRVRFQLVQELIRSLTRGHVLDAGCGTGFLLDYLVGQGFSVAGCDLSSGMLNQARERLAASSGSIQLVETGLDDLSAFDDHAFEHVFCLGVLPYIPEESEVPCFQELHRVLKPGGKLILAHSNELFDLITFNRYTGGFFARRIAPLLVELGADGDPDTVEGSIRQLVSHPDEPRQHDPKRSGRNSIFVRGDNPLAFAEKLRSFGLEQEDLLYYHFHAMPPLAQNQEPTWREASHKMEIGYARHWLGTFLASSFISVSRAQS